MSSIDGTSQGPEGDKTTRVITNEDISAYVDGELGPESQLNMSEAAQADPRLSALAERYRAQNRELHELYDHYLNAPIPERTLSMLLPSQGTRSGTPSGAMSWLRLAAAFSGVFLVGGLAGWLGHSTFDNRSSLLQPLVRQAVLAHRMLSAAAPAQENLVSSDSDIVSVGVLPEAFEAPLRAPSLRGLGTYRPVAFRRSVGSTGSSVQVMYRDSEKKSVTLFVLPHSAQRRGQFEFRQEADYNTLLWIDGPLAYVLVAGNLSEVELNDVARTIYRAPAFGDPEPSEKSASGIDIRLPGSHE